MAEQREGFLKSHITLFQPDLRLTEYSYLLGLRLNFPRFVLLGCCGLCGFGGFLNHPLCLPLSLLTKTTQDVVPNNSTRQNNSVAIVLNVFIFSGLILIR
jgi:hypothetical protein